MSYCRWSSLDYTCDVYVYESDNGWETNVASRRVVWKIDLPPPALVEGTDPERYLLWMQRGTVVKQLYDDGANWYWYKLPKKWSGKSFTDSSPGECAARLIEMKTDGLVVPYWAIEDLLADQKALEEHQ